MKSLLNRLHARLGDLWWYSLMIFVACRSGDVIQAFIGLWLVPKYVGPEELGAVLPLSSFASFLALPVSIFAMAFAKEITTLATKQRYGEMKTLIRGVFLTVAAALILAIIASRLLMPLFLERIRIAEGSLGLLILISAFLACTAPIYTNALQALKKFKALSVLNLIYAPIRLIVLLITMPIRPLSGYFVGQASTPFLQVVTSVFCLKKELSVPAERYWNKTVFRRFGVFIMGISGYMFISALTGLVENLVLRQRLPDIESAAYYMTTRFSEISAFVTGTLLLTLFPFTAEMAENGKATRPLVLKVSAITILFGALLAGFFLLFGKQLIHLLPNGDRYSEYAWAIPWLIAITTIGSIWGYHANTEISAGRFGFLKWWIPTGLIYPAAMMLVTGHGYFTHILPVNLVAFLKTHNIASLQSFLCWTSAITAIRVAFTLIDLIRQKATPTPRPLRQ